jgi:hypothetical protein
VGEKVGDSVVGDAVGLGLLVVVGLELFDFFLYVSRKGGNVTSTGNGVGGLVTGKGVGSGEGDVGVDVRIRGAGVGGFVPSTPMFEGGNSIAVGEVSVIGGVCRFVTGFEVGELVAGFGVGGSVAGFAVGGSVAGV